MDGDGAGLAGSGGAMNAHGGPDGRPGPDGSGGGKSSGRRMGWRIRFGVIPAVAVAVLIALGVGIGVWLWSGRAGYTDELGAYELPAQSGRRYARDDIIAMVDDCNERAAGANGTVGTDASTTDAAPFAVEDAGTSGANDDETSTSSETTGMKRVRASDMRQASTPSGTVGPVGTGAADDNTYPPTTVTLTIPATASAEPLDSQPFRCMAKTLGMPRKTQRDLVAQSEAFDSGEGAMPMTWNDLGFRGWKAPDGTFRLRITWYDPAAQEE
ncbi:hypothetical protein JS528_07860 [Bifidobacterium sp. MA2]|uniref:Secreted protein n=1 Tax=Bifidobacterium santillanense TaxID=2809028 RepID=A0ABS5UQM1_9BIFI|nr:hypothetical protein [Bifidobacterium santillanense]MBT1173265.1 hypothetical protein [Bifidobacterium santillanense]